MKFQQKRGSLTALDKVIVKIYVLESHSVIWEEHDNQFQENLMSEFEIKNILKYTK